MTTVTEIGPDIFRISTFVPDFNLQFNEFLVRDTEPLLFHTGLRHMFPEVREAVATIIDPTTLRWIGFSHFEADECGSLNDWLSIAPEATAVCSLVGAMVSVNDFAIREARPLMHDELLTTGAKHFRFRQTPHVPHCWDAGLLFEETTSTLFCSDLFSTSGDGRAVDGGDLPERAHAALVTDQAGMLANAMPYTALTSGILNGLADLKPTRLAVMHGSSYEGDGAEALRRLDVSMREVLGVPV